MSEEFYRVKVEESEADEPAHLRKVLALHVYRDGVEVEAHTFDLSAAGARGLFDEVRWLEWKRGDPGGAR